MRDRRLIAIIGTGVVAIATILIIVFAAIEPLPDFSELEPGDQSGYVAYAIEEDDRPGTVRIVDLATTEVVETELGREGEPLGWDEEGNLVIVQWGPTERFILVNPTSGEEVGTLDSEEGRRFFDEGAERGGVWVDHRDGRIILERVEGPGFASFTAPESYDIYQTRTMGEDRIAFVDELGRVAVTYLGEEVTPVLVGDNAIDWVLAARP